MKVVFDRKKIIEAVAPAMYACAGRSTIAAIEGILIDASADEDKCVLTTYDMEKGIRTSAEATVIEPGACIINANKFYQIIRVMEGEEVTLAVDANYSVEITSEKSSFSLHALPAKDFPNLPRLAGERGFSIGQGTLKSMIAKVEHSIAVNDQRNVLNGCYFRIEENKIMLVSCDSYKLSKCTKVCELESKMANGKELDLAFIVPGKTLAELVKLIGDDDEKKLDIILTLKHVIFKIGELYFFSRVIDSEYIDYERVIIKTHKIFVELSRAEFLGALERAALVTEERIAGNVRAYVKFDFIGGKLHVSSVSATGKVYEEIDIDHEGADLEIGFNNRYVIDTLRALSAERIRLSLSSPLMSMNIEPVDKTDGEDEIFMVLPVRMRE